MAQKTFVTSCFPDISSDYIDFAEMARRHFAILVASVSTEPVLSFNIDKITCQPSLLRTAVWYNYFIDNARRSFS
jgi:hypothetical protein